MSLVASTLGIGRSTMYDCLSGSTNAHGLYATDNAVLLAQVRQIAAQRPTFGYRRIAAILNRQLRAEGLAPVNHKPVRRIMVRGALKHRTA